MQNAECKMVRRLWLVACGLSLVLSAGCEVAPAEKFEPQLLVACLLQAGKPAHSTAWLHINRSYHIDEPFDSVFPGATGFVWSQSDTWPVQWWERDWYLIQDSDDSMAIRPGDTFSIRVANDGFDTVFGHTVVPDTFAILFPRDGDTVSIADSMVWTRSRNCAGYYMSFKTIQGRDTFFTDLAIPNDTTGGNFDSLVFRLDQMFFLYWYEPGLHTLWAYALDTNYFDWVSAGGFGPGSGGGDTTHLVGGLGVFGSAAVESLTIYVRTDTTGPRGDGRIQNSDVRVQKSEVADTDGGTRCTVHGVRFTGRVGRNALRSGIGVVAAGGPFLAFDQPFRHRGKQLLPLDRLVDERVGPALERGLDVFLGHAPGENQDWCLERPGALEHRAD
jgi:hypothetical protein